MCFVVFCPLHSLVGFSPSHIAFFDNRLNAFCVPNETLCQFCYIHLLWWHKFFIIFYSAFRTDKLLIPQKIVKVSLLNRYRSVSCVSSTRKGPRGNWQRKMSLSWSLSRIKITTTRDAMLWRASSKYFVSLHVGKFVYFCSEIINKCRGKILIRDYLYFVARRHNVSILNAVFFERYDATSCVPGDNRKATIAS